MDRKVEEKAADAERLARTMQDFAERSRRIAETFLQRQQEDNGFQVPDPAVIAKAFMALGQRLMADPEKLTQAQVRLWDGHARLWRAAAQKAAGEPAEPVAEPDKGDRRFKDAEWNENALYDFIKQSYLLCANWMQATVKDVDGLDPKTAEKVDFYTRQFIDAMAPSNFVMTNPKVLRETVKSGGENLLSGMENLLGDLEKGKGRLQISMTDASAFRLGENVATTPGQVIFQNDLMQLIQYAPSTKKVAKTPLLIVPPWINKYYILDLKPENSFIKWAVDQGWTVFVISWVNPDESLRHKSFDDYMLEGPLAALGAVERATGEAQSHVVGYCIGGTLLAATLAYLTVGGQGKRVVSATFLTSMIDFSEPGELGVFIDDEQLDLMDEHMQHKGYLEGRHMMMVFNMMRDKDLIWSFVVNNYLLGRRPLPFDLLYWNADSTRMPEMMHRFYLRKMYLENKLIEPGGITLAGVPVDLTRIETPVYMLSTREDHIAPWKSTYAATAIYAGSKRFVLSASGHIAGVVNPPAKKKYCYWTNPKTPKSPDAWLEGAARHEGSWWPDWMAWLDRQGDDKKVAPRRPGAGALKAIEDAPGSYVGVRAAE